MKISSAVVFAVAAADEKKVPPRHPLQRLNKLVSHSAELLNDHYGFLPSKEAWIQKFATNAERMRRNFSRDNQRCGFYDEAQLPHGGPARKRRTAEGDEDDIFRYDRTNPILGTRQITSGFRKWAERYIANCSGQKNNKFQVNRMNRWRDTLQGHLLANQANQN
jgi:hypothetical protein